jgi:hypothetical protein
MPKVGAVAQRIRFRHKDTSPAAMERRISDRRSLRLPLVMCVFNQTTAFEGFLINSSEDGICAETGCSIVPGTSLWVRMSAGPSGKKVEFLTPESRVTALGQVKWCRAIHEGESPIYRTGIRCYHTVDRVGSAADGADGPEHDEVG